MGFAPPLQYAPPSRRRRSVLFAGAAFVGIGVARFTPDGLESPVAVMAVGILALITGVLSSWSP